MTPDTSADLAERTAELSCFVNRYRKAMQACASKASTPADYARYFDLCDEIRAAVDDETFSQIQAVAGGNIQ